MILYFSGTGNSLSVAKQIADASGDEAINIQNASQHDVEACEQMGFVFPVYNFDMPILMKQFIETLENPKWRSTFAIITHGGDRGNALYNLQQLLETKNIKLNYINDLLMPVSSRIMYGMVTDKIETRNAEAKTKVALITEELLQGKQNVPGIRKKHLLAMMSRLVDSDYIKQKFTPVIDSETCINCGICQSVCPARNISTNSETTSIGSDCVQCMTCMHWCPQVSIHFKKKSVSQKQQYHHPDVKLKAMRIETINNKLK